MAPPAVITIFDSIYDSAGNAVAKAPVTCILNGTQETTSGGLIAPQQQSTVTDGSGRFAFTVVCNDLLSPANSTYTILTPFRAYDIAPQSANGSSQQTTAANVIVNTPSALAPATSNITGNLTIAGTLTVSGLITAQAGLTVSGTLSIPAGGFSMAGPLTLTAAGSQIIPGATSFSVRDNANANDNLLVSNAGLVTARAGLVATAGGLTVSAGGAVVTGNSTVTGTLTVTSTINSQTISAAANFTGSLTVASGFTLTAGNLAVTAGNLSFAAASPKIIPGATSLLLRNNADNASNLAITDVGLLTARNAIEVPPSAGGSLPTHPYGTLANLLDSQSGSAVASLTLTVTGGNYRSLIVEVECRSDQAATQPVNLQFNADTGGNYDTSFLQNANATLSGGAATVAGTSGRCALAAPTGATAGAVSATTINILNADSATQRKNWHYVANQWATDAAANALYEAGQGQWRNTANAITSIKLLPVAGNFAVIRARVYGLP